LAFPFLLSVKKVFYRKRQLFLRPHKPLPVKCPDRKKFHFSPSHPSASRVNIKLYDGGADQLSKDYTPLKTATLQVQPVNTESENNNRIEISVSMSDDGLVSIEAVDTLLNQPVAIELNLEVAKQSNSDLSSLINE
jgi:hypothetical protein